MTTKSRRVGAIIKNSQNIVLIHRLKNKDEYYAIPGGGIEKGETPRQAIEREIFEELGLNITSYEEIGSFETDDRYDVYFICTTNGTSFTVTGSEEKHLNDPINLFDPQWINSQTINRSLKIYPESGAEIVLKYINGHSSDRSLTN